MASILKMSDQRDYLDTAYGVGRGKGREVWREERV
jgi:hypothetical protein